MSTDNARHLSSREAITQAVDILTARHNVSAATAYEMLVEGSADSSEKVREVASRIVAAGSAEHHHHSREVTTQDAREVEGTDVEVSLGGAWYPAELLEWHADSDGWAARVRVHISGTQTVEALVANDLVRVTPATI